MRLKHENEASGMIGCFQVVRIYSFMKKIKLYIQASHIVFLFVRSENNDFVKETKHVLHAITAWSYAQATTPGSPYSFRQVLWVLLSPLIESRETGPTV